MGGFWCWIGMILIQINILILDRKHAKVNSKKNSQVPLLIDLASWFYLYSKIIDEFNFFCEKVTTNIENTNIERNLLCREERREDNLSRDFYTKRTNLGNDILKTKTCMPLLCHLLTGDIYAAFCTNLSGVYFYTHWRKRKFIFTIKIKNKLIFFIRMFIRIMRLRFCEKFSPFSRFTNNRKDLILQNESSCLESKLKRNFAIEGKKEDIQIWAKG